ncbi:hypothetical protein VTN77DRAFT_2955 [Rasamsonia byssochlamydoides]|uniref:uncharacterized protein n=1 Tax=Rasamsonia byssochlamydoides TaxID=89139 RepID=UPI0037425F2B
MAYDKHGLLDLILHEDGHEEARKPARKPVWSMKREQIALRLAEWLPAIAGHQFTTADIMDPVILRNRAHALPDLVGIQIDAGRGQLSSVEHDLLRSCHQLLVDLEESITRCESVEMYITTNLFAFWTIDQALPLLEWATRLEGICAAVVFLRAYISAVLVAEV